MKNQKLTLEIVKHILKLNGLTEKENDILNNYRIQDLIIDQYSFPMFSCFISLDNGIIKIIVIDLSYHSKEYALFFNIHSFNQNEWIGIDAFLNGDDLAIFKRYDKSWQDVEIKTQAKIMIGFEDLCNFPRDWKINEKISQEELKMIKEFVE
jgi:hypothetical protein